MLIVNEPKWHGFAALVPNWDQMETYEIKRILHVVINVIHMVYKKNEILLRIFSVKDMYL